MERRVVCVTVANGSNYDDCRQISKIGYELRDGVYERDPEYIHRRIDDGEEFCIKGDGEKRYLEAVSDKDEEDEDEEAADDEDAAVNEDDEDEDVRKYVRIGDEDTADDLLLTLDAC